MKLVKAVYGSLDDLKRLTNDGIEYWMARDLQGVLGYVKWDKFEGVIKKAQMSCESTGTDPNNHILHTGKLVDIGSGAERKRNDYFVSRYGAYIIAMNGNPRVPEIATAQMYFAVQTRRQELSDQAYNIDKRIELRDRVKSANKHLGDAAKDSGVQDYARFHAAGYRGLYNLGLNQIKERKNIDPKDELLDRAGRAELAANEFRITQTEQALKRDKIEGDIPARKTHEKVGKEIRSTIAKLGRTMPEDLPAEPSIKKLIAGSQKKTKLLKKKEEPDENGKS